MAGTYSRSTQALVIGGGPGGYMAAIRLGQLGVRTLLVEQEFLGGECLNRGCIPSKALIHASTLYHALRTEGPELGIRAESLAFELGTTQKWKEEVVRKERDGVALLLKSAGVTWLPGHARFSGPKSAQLEAPDGGSERIDFENAIIATGAIPASIPGFEPDGTRILNASQILTLSKLPESLIVLGGGVSGCELGEFMAQVGVKVTIVELLAQLLPGMEPDLSRELTMALQKLGVQIRTSTRATGVNRSGGGVSLDLEGEKGTEQISGDQLFLTIGKRPNIADLGLEEAGVRAEKGGFLATNDKQQTNLAHIFAVGDVARPPMLAHKAYREGVVAAEVIAGKPSRFQFQTIPSVVFTTPELASTGLTLEEARAQGLRPREARFVYAALGRAHAAHAASGWLKIVGDDATGLVLGVHAVGAQAGEFAAEAALAIEMAATVRDVASTIHPHPTFSESLQEASCLWLDEPMHVARRSRNVPRS